MTHTPAKIEIRNLSKAFGAKTVLDGLNLSIPDKTSMVVIGGSGTGKSVLIKCITGIMEADDGEILIDGEDVLALRPRDREALPGKIGMLFQGSALFDSLPVWENVAFGLIQSGVPRRRAREIAVDKLARVRLGPEVAGLMAAELSGGMQKRVSLARAIASDPEIIFFDEPTNGLDPITAHVIDDLIVESVRSLGATTLSITHDMPSVRRIADRVAMLHSGAIVWNGPVSELDGSGNDFVDQFIHGRAEGPIQMELRR
ncbi:MAG: ATP-binding cassette domain-containing protein [Alphaproteobacteria bacterium]